MTERSMATSKTVQPAGNGHSADWQIGHSLGVMAYRKENVNLTYGALRMLAESAHERASHNMTLDKDQFVNGYFSGWEVARKKGVTHAKDSDDKQPDGD